jgi:hypothetical protein
VHWCALVRNVIWASKCLLPPILCNFSVQLQPQLLERRQLVSLKILKKHTQQRLKKLRSKLKRTTPSFINSCFDCVQQRKEFRGVYNMHFSIDISIILRRYQCDTHPIPAWYSGAHPTRILRCKPVWDRCAALQLQFYLQWSATKGACTCINIKVNKPLVLFTARTMQRPLVSSSVSEASMQQKVSA